MPKTYEVKVRESYITLAYVEAKSEAEARKKFKNGECSYFLDEPATFTGKIIAVKEV